MAIVYISTLFESDEYYLQVHQTVYFNQTPHKNSNLKEAFEVKYRERKYPEFKRVIEISDSWCIMEDIDIYNKLKEKFKFLTLIV